MSGEPALEPIAGEGRHQHEPGGGLERAGRHRPEFERLGATEAAGSEVLELLLLSHEDNIGRRPGDL